ncbi:MAG: metallophosphoesterase [Lachnospiraceae bacterium]|nr:metallophosphoesterase [Lachnospiraceae bacterium]
MAVMEKENQILKLAAAFPSVYAVEKEYQICVPVREECTMWVQVGQKHYYDHSNGILRSGKFLHLVHVPQEVLDREKRYVVYLRRINERKSYFTDCGELESATYDFRPLMEKEAYHIVNLADAHNLVQEPVSSGSYFGDQLDLLIMNGDIPNSGEDISFFLNIYLISGAITKGRVPCVFSRGNHDMRGKYAEQLADYTPVSGGRSYYTFQLGPVWGIVLDAGEDKVDACEEYGHTICCEAFREEEEEFLDRVIAAGEYRSASVRLVISHHPITWCIEPPFDIEKERYARWAAKLKEVKPVLWLSGHLHVCFLEDRGGAHDSFGRPCAQVCSSYNDMEKHRHISGAIILTKEEIRVKYITEQGKIWGEETLPINGFEEILE